MSVYTEFRTCQYKESQEYKLKDAIQNYCNNEDNWIIAISKLDLLKTMVRKFNIPSFTQDIIAKRIF